MNLRKRLKDFREEPIKDKYIGFRVTNADYVKIGNACVAEKKKLTNFCQDVIFGYINKKYGDKNDKGSIHKR